MERVRDTFSPKQDFSHNYALDITDYEMKKEPSERLLSTEIEITPAMMARGLDWLYAFNRDYSDGRKEVMEILRLALPNHCYIPSVQANLPASRGH
jgi:hypothetical protein